MSSRTIPLPPSTIYSDVTVNDGHFVFLTGYIPTSDARFHRFIFEIAGTTDGSGVVRPGLQCAQSAEAPASPIVLTGAVVRTGDGLCFPDVWTDMDATMKANQLVRAGVWFKASQAGLKLARIVGRWEMRDC